MKLKEDFQTWRLRLMRDAHIPEVRSPYNVLVRKQRKGPTGLPRLRSKYDIKLDFKEIWPSVLDWINLAQGLSGHGNEPSG